MARSAIQPRGPLLDLHPGRRDSAAFGYGLGPGVYHRATTTLRRGLGRLAPTRSPTPRRSFAFDTPAILSHRLTCNAGSADWPPLRCVSPGGPGGTPPGRTPAGRSHESRRPQIQRPDVCRYCRAVSTPASSTISPRVFRTDNGTRPRRRGRPPAWIPTTSALTALTPPSRTTTRRGTSTRTPARHPLPTHTSEPSSGPPGLPCNRSSGPLPDRLTRTGGVWH